MKTMLKGAALAAVLFGGVALAQDAQIEADVQSTETQDQSGINADLDVEPEADVSGQSNFTGTGGSGQEGTTTSTTVSEDGASTTVTTQEGTGGSGEAYVGDATTVDTTRAEKEEADMRGLVVTLGGGAEGYTGALRRQIDAGAAWGVSAAIKPTKILGLEFGYTGAANELGNDAFLSDNREATGGPDMIRNGGHALATVGLGAAPVQPYILGGVGINRYTVRADTSNFRDDTSGNVPLGLGVRTHVGNFTADLRGTYSVLFDTDFARNDGASENIAGESFLEAGRWNGMLQIGTTW